MLYLQLPLISLNLVLVQANHKEDEPQEKNYYGSPTRGGLPIVAQPIQGTGTSDGHSTSRAERQSDLARIGPANNQFKPSMDRQIHPDYHNHWRK